MRAEKIREFFGRWRKSFMRGFRARPGLTWARARLSVEGGLADSLRTESERFFIVPILTEDAPALRALTDSPAITSAISFLQSPFTIAAAAKLASTNYAGDEDCFMGIRRKADNALVGVCGAHLRGERTIEIGYWVGTAYQNQGYASEALAALIAKLYVIYPGRQVIAECAPENAASVRVLWKLGFTKTDTPGNRPGRMVYALREPLSVS